MTPSAPSVANTAEYPRRESQVPRQDEELAHEAVRAREARSDESVTMTKAVAMTGTRFARPPYSEMRRVWRRS